MAVPLARPFATRLRNLGAFVAIVWGIATTFVAFDIVALSGVDLMLANPSLFGDIALSRTVTSSTSCEVRPGDTPARPPTVGARDAEVGAWLLGLSLGREALLRQYAGANVQVLDQLAAERSPLAERLGVPAPAVFRFEQIANANIEFVAVVEQDPAGTANRLAVTFSPRACELFKLGALWGYSEMIRPALPGERAVFAMEIRHHALRADVPEPLWSPMLQRVAADAKSEDVMAQMNALTSGMTTHLTDPAAAQPKSP